MENEVELLSPTEYFETIKEKQQDFEMGEKELKVYNNAVSMLEKAIAIGQVELAKNLMFQIKTLNKEMELVKLGKNSYITREDISKYIENTEREHLALVQLKDYPREIPNDVYKEFVPVKDLFDDFYVLFTDYTGEIRKELKNDQEEKDKDPILFGIFKDRSCNKIHERFYVVGSWEDEYCDLTLERFLEESEELFNKDVLQESLLPTSIEKLQNRVASMNKSESDKPNKNWRDKLSKWLRGR